MAHVNPLTGARSFCMTLLSLCFVLHQHTPSPNFKIISLILRQVNLVEQQTAVLGVNHPATICEKKRLACQLPITKLLPVLDAKFNIMCLI